jgi:hypothetical protein
MSIQSDKIHIIQQVMGIPLKQLLHMDSQEINDLYWTSLSYIDGEETA